MQNQPHKEEINIFELIATLWRYKWVLVAMPILVTSVVITVLLLTENRYTSKVELVLETSTQSGLAASLPLGLAGIAGVGQDNPAERLILLHLESFSFYQKIIENYALLDFFLESEDVENLKKLTDLEKMNLAVSAFKASLKHESNLDVKTISLHLETTEAAFSQKILKIVVTELKKSLNQNRFSASYRKRKFIKKQLVRYRKEFLELGKILSNYYQSKNVSNISAELDVNVSQLFSLSSYQKKQSAQDEIVKNVPQAAFWEYLRMYKEALGQVIQTLTQQLEHAKIEENSTDYSFFYLDEPHLPLEKSSPKRTVITLLAFIASCFFSLLLVFLLDFLKKNKQEFLKRF